MEMTIGVDEDPKGTQMDGSDVPRKNQKRKRVSLKPEEKAAQMEDLRLELDGLFKYYKEMKEKKVFLDVGMCSSSSSTVAVLMEESELPLSKLVEEIHQKLKDVMSAATVKNSVLKVGQRVMYGVPNVEADVLEDQSQTCLWCWETRDMKLIPKAIRAELNLRRTCRKKIHERITAVSAMMTALQKSESNKSYKHDLAKAVEKLGKVHKEADIRSYVDKLLQKNGADMAEKEAKREGKMRIKDMERNNRDVEKEKKRMERELQKEKLQNEKEAEKDEKRREKEESEMRKQLRKQQEEAERDQRRREKEEAELKKQLSIQKQASIMERFLKKSKTSTMCNNGQSSTKIATSDSTSKKSEKMPDAVTVSMDCALSTNDEIGVDDVWKVHLSSWHCLGHSIRSNRQQHWGIRQKPKTELFKELKLSAIRVVARDDDLNIDKLADGWGEQISDDRFSQATDCSLPDVKKFNQRKQLLQFAKSHRPAFYGIWHKKSHVVGPRHPFKKDPDVEYDIDSDDEWEEEDPGESLSDCDKDEEEETLEEGCSRVDDEEESEDGFFVPDGYLSDNEGVQVDRMETDVVVEEARSSPSCKEDSKSGEFCTLLRQQKYLNNLTEQALRRNQPLIVLNLMHEKAALLMAEDLIGTPKLEQMCLQALSMCIFPDSVEISIENMEDEDQEACLSSGKSSTTLVSTVNNIPDTDLPTVVSAIQSSPQGINKVIESLQQKFPAASKSVLKNRVREISDFVDNRWQVKKEILNKLGMSISPEKGGGRTKSIATFFSKRCLPPAGRNINHNETSPQPSLKPSFTDQ
ncbi:chromatin assembly factor 1 subunit fas1 [Quercus suber]|uniref:Chromatin assembly factor 1 subunit fas1 n=2 Tax=Quercus suber TaxID=58331 RepID=A0AAW0M073_QUESU